MLLFYKNSIDFFIVIFINGIELFIINVNRVKICFIYCLLRNVIKFCYSNGKFVINDKFVIVYNFNGGY